MTGRTVPGGRDWEDGTGRTGPEAQDPVDGTGSVHRGQYRGELG